MGGFAWVTLATNDSYSLGALVLANSLKQSGTSHQLVVLVTPGVTSSMREKLATVFNVVQEVNILDSRDELNLRLLKRPELGITFTKLHCWRLTQFDKCVFLDADTLVLRNCDELFDREELSAAPDVGWPDCFNSGVFVYRPSNETYEKLVQFALEKGSFDGGDQGLLNLYFSDWATKDISKHLPFIYNLSSTATYSYLPAFKQFGINAKIVHFIGNSKPWLQYFNTETRQVQPSPDLKHLEGILQHWWNIFCSLVHPNLTPDMGGLAGAFAQLTLGAPRTAEQSALDDHLRRQGWEVGNIDYMGRDSFDNIWSKICETLSAGTQTVPPKAPEATTPSPSDTPLTEETVREASSTLPEKEVSVTAPLVSTLDAKDSLVISSDSKPISESSDSISLKQPEAQPTDSVISQPQEVPKTEAISTVSTEQVLRQTQEASAQQETTALEKTELQSTPTTQAVTATGIPAQVPQVEDKKAPDSSPQTPEQEISTPAKEDEKKIQVAGDTKIEAKQGEQAVTIAPVSLVQPSEQSSTTTETEKKSVPQEVIAPEPEEAPLEKVSPSQQEAIPVPAASDAVPVCTKPAPSGQEKTVAETSPKLPEQLKPESTVTTTSSPQQEISSTVLVTQQPQPAVEPSPTTQASTAAQPPVPPSPTSETPKTPSGPPPSQPVTMESQQSHQTPTEIQPSPSSKTLPSEPLPSPPVTTEQISSSPQPQPPAQSQKISQALVEVPPPTPSSPTAEIPKIPSKPTTTEAAPVVEVEAASASPTSAESSSTPDPKPAAEAEQSKKPTTQKSEATSALPTPPPRKTGGKKTKSKK